jgi:hypothetical protein
MSEYDAAGRLIGTRQGATGPIGSLPVNVQQPQNVQPIDIVVPGSNEYHKVFQVRRYDLFKLRKDLDRLDTKGRWLVPAGFSMATTFIGSFTAWAIEVWGNNNAAWDLEFGLIAGAIMSAILALVFLYLDKFIGVRATADLQQLKDDVDELISMFPDADE